MINISRVLCFLFLILSPNEAASENVSPTEIKGATTINAVKAKQLFEKGAAFVDVRTDADYAAGRVPGAHHLELNKRFRYKALASIVGKNDEVVFYCNGKNCPRSSQASEQAVAWGFSNIYYFRDGMPA